MSVNQGEHTFQLDILKHGRKLRGFTAASDLTAGEPVGIIGDNEVGPSPDGGPAIGVVGYDVTAGEEVVILGDDCEVRLDNVDSAFNAGEEITPDGAGAFRQAGSTDDGLAIIVNSGSNSVVYIKAASGTTI